MVFKKQSVFLEEEYLLGFTSSSSCGDSFRKTGTYVLQAITTKR